MLGLLLAAITVSTGFEAGRLGKVETVSPTHLQCAVAGQSDQDGRNRQANWYYFRLDGLPQSAVVIDLVNLVGEYNYRPGTHAVTKGTRPVYSYDQQTWTHFSDNEVEWDEKTVRLGLRFTPKRSRMWIAHVPPYTNADLRKLLDGIGRSGYVEQATIGKTAGGRDIPLLTVTDPKTPDSGKKNVWLMCRQHAWEAPTSHVCEGALRLLTSQDPVAQRIRREAVFRVIPMADPDGVASGAVRFNANGYDLNRNWDLVDPAKMPEIAAERRAILGWVDGGGKVDLFLTLHNTENAEYLEGSFPDGNQAPERLFRLLSENTSFYPTIPLRRSETTTTPGKPGRMTVYQGLYHDRKIPALLMEQMVEYNAKLGRVPVTEDRLRFGAGLVRGLWAAVTGGIW